jgi:hypothetical protein
MIKKIIFKIKNTVLVILGKKIQKIYLNIYDYQKLNPELNIKIQKIDSARLHHLNLPKYTNEILPERFHINVFKAYHDVYLAELQNCKIALIDYRVGVITEDNSLLEDLSPDHARKKEHPFLFYTLPKTKQKLKGKTLVLAAPEGHGNYYHWMFHVIGRLSVLKALEMDINDFDHIVINKPYKAFQEQSIKDFCFPLDKLVFIDNGELLQLENAVLPSYLYFHPMVPHFLRRHYLKNIKTSNTSKKVYISRRKSPIRKLLQEDLLVELLVKEFNYIEVFLEDLNLEQQAILLNECSHVIAPHGAGLPNIVYCNPGTKVLEILPYTWTNVIYWIYAEYQHLEYSVFLAGDKNAHPDGYLDYNLDLFKFKEFLIKSEF